LNTISLVFVVVVFFFTIFLMCLIWQVIYGSAIIDPTSLTVLSALVDHWMHTGGPKREIGRYHTPQQFFVPMTKLNALLQAVETANPPLVLTAELCGLYFTPIVRSNSRLLGKGFKFKPIYLCL